MTEVADVVEQNEKAWNEVASRHAELNWEETRKKLQDGNSPYIHKEFVDLIGMENITGKAVVQFNCNNARELISCVQLGAAKGFGVDISEEFVSQARELVAATDANVEIIHSDIYRLGEKLDGAADLLLATSGALCWMGDLKRYFQAASKTLKPGGILAIHETHPFLEIFQLDREKGASQSPVPHYSYFMNKPIKSTQGLDYYSNEVYGSEVVYWYHHNFTTIIQAILASDFQLLNFGELKIDLDSGYSRFSRMDVELPMSYVLTAQAK